MKKISDKQIRELIDRHLISSPEDPDSELYALLYESLESDTEAGLPYNFASNVTAEIQLQEVRKISFTTYSLAFCGVIVIIGVFIGILRLIGDSTSVLELLEYKWYLLFGITAFLAAALWGRNRDGVLSPL